MSMGEAINPTAGAARSRGVTAVLGPTNTGKTHLAIERMLGHETGLIGLPLRLLAREVYDKILARGVSPSQVALITGEEKIKPDNPRFYVCTVEAMPREVTTDFVAIDEIQLCADADRGHVFTDRLFHARGHQETLLLGAQTMTESIREILPGTNFITRPRFSKLTFSGQKKLTRLPGRTAVVAFSATDVYEIAELIRRQRGGAAVVLGALSPRTRNAQVALYQSGQVEFLVATDAIGMGLNLEVDHVAFAGTRKFDGQFHRELTPAEIGQIAGRAGRYLNDGTFGVTGDAEPFSSEIIDRIENHNFETVRTLQWRNRSLDFDTLEGLRESLRQTPNHQRLARARMADDVAALENVAHLSEVRSKASAPAAIRLLWDTCQIPDYRKISESAHAELVATVYKFLMSDDGRIPADWFEAQVGLADRTDGDIDTLSNRLAHIRTWTFVSNRNDWLADPDHWQARTRAIEDQLSDALHERLTQRFVDQRTSVLMKRLRDDDGLQADIAEDGAIKVEDHYVGRIMGFRFTPATDLNTDIQGKATRAAASKVLQNELGMRARRVASAKSDAFTLTRQGKVFWRGEEIAELTATDDRLRPQLSLLADEHLAAGDKEKVTLRLNTWLTELIDTRLAALVDLMKAEDVTGLARGMAFRLMENFGVLPRDSVAEDVKTLDQNARAQLRKYGVRFGAFHIYIPLLLKPAATDLRLTLWTLTDGAKLGFTADKLPEPPRPGLTSVPGDIALPDQFYQICGFKLCGTRAVRIDMLERLSDMIRPLVAFRARDEGQDTPPKGASGDGGFLIQPEMMSILGCSQEELGNILKALGFRLDRRPEGFELPSDRVRKRLAAEADARRIAEAAAADEQLRAAEAAAAAEDLAPADTTVAEAEAAETLAQPFEPEAPAEINQPEPMLEAVAIATPKDAPVEAESALEAPETVIAAEGAVDAVEAAAEPVYVEIWRPRRRQEHGPQRADRRPGPRRDRQPGTQTGERRADGRTGHNRPQAAAVGGDQAASTEAGEQRSGDPRGGFRRDHQRRDEARREGGENRRDDRPRNDRPRDDRPREAGAKEDRPREDRVRDDKPRDDRPRDNKPRDDRPRDDRPRDDRNRDNRGRRDDHNRGPRVMSAAPPLDKSAKAGDPQAVADSPFAALQALRDKLSSRKQDQA